MTGMVSVLADGAGAAAVAVGASTAGLALAPGCGLLPARVPTSNHPVMAAARSATNIAT